MVKNSSKAPPPAGVIRQAGSGVEIQVTVVPRSSCSAAAGVQDGRLKLKITKPPVDGQANAECIRVMAELLGVSRARVALVRGHASRHKVLCVDGMTGAEVLHKLHLS
jgi:uncharacterized protein (TIGR00251 family)